MKVVTHIHPVEKRVIIVHVVLEYADVLENLCIDLDPFIVANRIFAEEVERDEVGRFECDMLATQRAATNRIRLILALLVTSTKGQFVDEIHGGGTLTLSRKFRLKLGVIVLPDSVDMTLSAGIRNECEQEGEMTTNLEFPRLLELAHVTLTFQ